MSKATTKHFLDTSVARPILLGTVRYKQYLKSKIDPKSRYISHYVQMEIKRSYIVNIISFYFILRLDTIQTISDAIAFWSNSFQGSKHKAIEQLVSQLLSTQYLNFNHPQDKEKALHVLGIYIKRFEMSLRRKFKDIGRDSTHCTRAQVFFKMNLENMADGLKQFIDEFNDVATCRNKCHVDRFLLERQRKSVEAYTQQATRFPTKSGTHKGFVKIADNLQEILEKGGTVCSCKRCEKIGDAIIALDAPREMQLEHIDQSFNYLCPVIDQPHRLHPPETQIILQVSPEEQVTEEED